MQKDQAQTETIDVINLAAYLLRHHIRVIGSSVTWGVDACGKPNGKLDVTLETELLHADRAPHKTG